VGKRGSSRNFIEALPIVLDRLAIHKGPDIGIKAAKFVLNVNKLLRVVNGGTNFKLVANNRRIVQQLPDLLVIKAGHLLHIEAGKWLVIAGAFVLGVAGTEPGRGAVKPQGFELFMGGMNGDAPFLITILKVFIEGVFAPAAPFFFHCLWKK